MRPEILKYMKKIHNESARFYFILINLISFFLVIFLPINNTLIEKIGFQLIVNLVWLLTYFIVWKSFMSWYPYYEKLYDLEKELNVMINKLKK